MAQFEKIDRMPEEILRRKSAGRDLSEEVVAFAALLPGETLKYTFADGESMERVRKRLEAYVKRQKKKGSAAVYRIAQKDGILYAGRLE